MLVDSQYSCLRKFSPACCNTCFLPYSMFFQPWIYITFIVYTASLWDLDNELMEGAPVFKINILMNWSRILLCPLEVLYMWTSAQTLGPRLLMQAKNPVYHPPLYISSWELRWILWMQLCMLGLLIAIWFLTLQ